VRACACACWLPQATVSFDAACMAFGDAYRPEEGNKLCLQQHGLTLHSGGVLILAANNCKKNGELDLACVICMVIFQTLGFF
jgi:hypothetical protein